MKSSSAPEYRAWINMKSRCNNPNTPSYHRYGGRGIRVCSEWESSFDAFLRDMGRRPSGLHTVERIDGNKGYELGNCRWATRAEQARNLSTNHRMEHGDREVIIAEAAREAGLNPNTVLYRVRRGWTDKQALSLPLQRGRRP